jgi:signal transduction histidine kinase
MHDSASRPSRLNLLLVATALVVVSALHYGTPRDPAFHALHDVWRRLYYVPIVLGAFHWGLRGGVLTALVATLLYLPHVLLQWGGMAHGNQYVEIVMFFVIGTVSGVLANELRQRRVEARQAYDQLQESFERAKAAERLAAMGQLSASLAHEIRNPLASLKGSLPILLEGIEPDDPRGDFADIVRREIARLEELTGSFLEYARPPRPSFAPDDIDALLTSVARLVEKEAELDLAGDLPPLRIDGNRIRQVILNLALNALQAMPDGGILRLRSAREDSEVLVEVEDSGPGIDPSVATTLFEPFVSTKEQGTGLGLAVVHQWVERHGGRVGVGPSEAGGARFSVHLPLEPEARAPA